MIVFGEGGVKHFRHCDLPPLAISAIIRRTACLFQPFYWEIADRARIALAVVDRPAAFSAAVEIGALHFAKVYMCGRVSVCDGLSEDCDDAFVESLGLWTRQRGRSFAWIEARGKEGLGGVNIAEAADLRLVQKELFDRQRTAFCGRVEIGRRKLL